MTLCQSQYETWASDSLIVMDGALVACYPANMINHSRPTSGWAIPLNSTAGTLCSVRGSKASQLPGLNK
jgi:hypothetical protein